MSTIGEFKPDHLIADTKIAPLALEIKVKKGQGVLLRGSVLGREETTKTCVLVDSTSLDESKDPFCILTDDVDTTEEVITTGYFTGVYHKEALIFGGDDTVETHENRLRELNLYLK